MDIYTLETELKSKSHNSTEDFIKYVLLEMQSPIEDYYLAIDLLKEEYPKTKDIRIAILGAYLSSTWLSCNKNEFLESLKAHLLEVDRQNKAIIYYLLAYDIYMKCDGEYPIQYSDLLQKSISYSQRFVNNYIRLAEATCSTRKDILFDKAILNVESVWSEQELDKLSINDFIKYESFVDEFILGVSISKDMYDALVHKKFL